MKRSASTEPSAKVGQCLLDKLKQDLRASVIAEKEYFEERKRPVSTFDERTLTPFQEQVINFSQRIQRIVRLERPKSKPPMTLEEL